jgi:hypothetical protein
MVDNHLLIGDLNQRKKKSKNFKINVSHVICETSFINIYHLFSNLNLYRQRISFFPFRLFVYGHLFFFRLIVFFSLFFSVVVIDVVLYFFSRILTFTHAHTMSRYLLTLLLSSSSACVTISTTTVYCLISLFFSLFSKFVFFSFFFLCVLHEKLKSKIEFIQ